MGTQRPEAMTVGAVRAGVIAACALAVVGVALEARFLRPVAELWHGDAAEVSSYAYAGLAVALLMAGTGAVVLLRGDAPRFGWFVLAAGVGAAVIGGAGEYALYAWYSPDGPLPGVRAAAWVQDLWLIWFMLLVLLIPSLFPDGRPAPGWRRWFRMALAGWTVLLILYLLADRAHTNVFEGLDGPVDPPRNPTGLIPEGVAMHVVPPLWVALMVASVVVSIGSMVRRWRTADATLRQQMKWVLLALGIACAGFGAQMVVTLLDAVFGVAAAAMDPVLTFQAFAWAGVVVAIGLSLTRYRLYDVDQVISRTAAYGVMTVLVVLAYVAVVVGVAATLPGADRLGLSLVATALVAVAFEPARRRVQRGVNRLLFGRRDDPYAVLAALGAQLATSGAPDHTLSTVTTTVKDALRVPGARIVVEGGDGDRVVADAGVLGEDPEEFALQHRRRDVGRLLVARRTPGEPLQAADRQLLEDVAHHAAAVADGVRLTHALQRSREALVRAREEERRRLRRDLHDGLGPTLASQTFLLDRILAMLPEDPETAMDQVASLKVHNAEAVAEIRRIVYELRPPPLDELGLAGALRAHAGQLTESGGPAVDVVSEPNPLGDLAAGVEVAGYQIVREAVTNAARHAAATRCRVELEADSAHLGIRVSDDGIGMPERVVSGVGLGSMQERAAELGGAVRWRPAPGGGTVVEATLPVDPAPQTDRAEPVADRPGVEVEDG